METKKEIHVLGLGPGIANYVNYDHIPTVGVNDIWRYHHTDYVVCIDKIGAFLSSSGIVSATCAIEA